MGTRSVKTLQVKRQSQKFRGYRDYIDGVPLEMVLIPDGTFTMGSQETEEGSHADERPQHHVTIRPPAKIGTDYVQ